MSPTKRPPEPLPSPWGTWWPRLLTYWVRTLTSSLWMRREGQGAVVSRQGHPALSEGWRACELRVTGPQLMPLTHTCTQTHRHTHAWTLTPLHTLIRAHTWHVPSQPRRLTCPCTLFPPLTHTLTCVYVHTHTNTCTDAHEQTPRPLRVPITPARHTHIPPDT